FRGFGRVPAGFGTVPGTVVGFVLGLAGGAAAARRAAPRGLARGRLRRFDKVAVAGCGGIEHLVRCIGSGTSVIDRALPGGLGAVAFGLALALLALLFLAARLLFLAAGVDLALGLAQQAQVMFGVLLEIL